VTVSRVEKYRPSGLEDLISHEEIISTSERNTPAHDSILIVLKLTYSHPLYKPQAIAPSTILRSTWHRKNEHNIGVRPSTLLAAAVQVHGFGAQCLG